MALSTWWEGDVVPIIAPLPDLTFGVEQRSAILETQTQLEPDELSARLSAGHGIHVARIGGEPVAYGWVASLAASIGELGLDFALPSGDRYLWDFVTLPAWRGRGIYPRLLQAILAYEAQSGKRFWIINAPENTASGAGISKAGFREVSDLAFRADGGVGSVSQAERERADLGAKLLGVPLLEAVDEGRVISPCWRCVVAAKHGEEAACWPYQGGIAVACTCA